jgi:hypothetical protein
MAPLKVGDKFPPTKFRYIRYTPETADVTACGIPEDFDTEKVSPGSRADGERRI